MSRPESVAHPKSGGLGSETHGLRVPKENQDTITRKQVKLAGQLGTTDVHYQQECNTSSKEASNVLGRQIYSKLNTMIGMIEIHRVVLGA